MGTTTIGNLKKNVMSSSAIYYFGTLMNKKIVQLILLVIYLVLGYMHISYVYNSKINYTKNESLHLANTIRICLPIDHVAKLKPHRSTINTESYILIKSKLMQLLTENKGVRFIYFLKLHSDSLFFLVDSEPVSSLDYSAPGDMYQNEKDKEVFVPFLSKKQIITQPTVDKWGTWVSVLVPIIDKGKVIAVLGVDYDEKEWYRDANTHSFQAFVMILAILMFLWSLIHIIIKNMHLNDSINTLNDTKNQLEEAKKLAEAASIAKSQFLSNMSHEIRTPLNGVVGFTELLRNTPLNNNQKEYLENAIISANSLLSVVNDILDFSKIESGKIELEKMKTDIILLIENAADIIKIMAEKKGIELLVNIQPDIPRFVYIDPVRTKQILVNLLSNAVKFTHKGEVEIKVSLKIKTKRIGVLCVSVCDTGIGIKENDKHKLFKAFSQADTSTTRRYGGTGLGLIISNSLAERMGGKIQLESEFGKGSTFSFSFDVAYEYGVSALSEKKPEINSVLVIDDNANNRKIIGKYLNYWGVQCIGVDNVKEAFGTLEVSIPDLIIVDYDMPDVNGIDTIKLIRQKYDTTLYNLPIMILHSSSEDANIQDLARSLRVSYTLTKPIKQNELLQYLCNLYTFVGQYSNNQDIKSKRDDAAQLMQKMYKVLVVEDTPMNMLLITNVLKSFFTIIEIEEAHNGYEALKKLEVFQADIILMDVQMPELDGIAATKKIREIKEFTNTPIIALTAGVSVEERNACFDAGMTDFLAKPIDRKDLDIVLKRYLKDIEISDVNDDQR